MRTRALAESHTILTVESYGIELSLQRTGLGRNVVDPLPNLVNTGNFRDLPIPLGDSLTLFAIERIQIQVTKTVPLASPEKLAAVEKPEQVVVIDPIGI